jgi:hypothetical protein
MSMQLIETKTLGATTASIEFTSIPQDGTDLVILYALRSNSAETAYDDCFLKPNSQTADLSSRVLAAVTPTVVSFTTSDIRIYSNAGNSTANTFNSGYVYLTNYSGSTAKSISADVITEGNQTTQLQSLTAGLWNSTSAITSLLIDSGPRSFVAGSIVSLYKITKGSDGIVTTS